MTDETKYYHDLPDADPIQMAANGGPWPLYSICTNMMAIRAAVDAGHVPPGTEAVLIDESDVPGGRPPVEHQGYLHCHHRLHNGPRRRYALVPNRSGVAPKLSAYGMTRPPGGWHLERMNGQ